MFYERFTGKKKMTSQRGITTLGELLGEQTESDKDEEVLERVKILAQEHLPEGWTNWEVSTVTKEEVFGEKIEPSVMNKLVFALPTVGLTRAFLPDANHLSEKGYRVIRLKLLDWAFTRALILGPPAVANRIRGSALRTELFKQAVEPLRPLLHTRSEADAILSGRRLGSEETNRKRRSNSSSTSYSHYQHEEPPLRRRRVESPSPIQDARIGALEQRVEDMFSIILERLEPRQRDDPESDKENESYDEVEISSEASNSPSWHAPPLDLSDWHGEGNERELEFLPSIKEADPLIPEPSAELKCEGIECQRLGTESWNRVRYKEVEKHLHAGSVFSALKVNTELGTLASQPSPSMNKQEGMLGTITHGLLLQCKALARVLMLL
ncbi:unnamed protein product [Diatraea saccharalis]|uniref:Uncharacterized protein n=1 Tax=Diatraea saccharalis TaxID=40085 RepID=A0A9N9WJ62_9NEOP|nr:unnamed protein product [Diatraea saccharalis]